MTSQRDSGTRPAPEQTGDLENARRLIMKYGWSATCYQILNPGFNRWFSRERDAVVGYVERGRYHIAGGAPICSHDRIADAADEFETWSRHRGRRTCYFAAEERLERHYRTSAECAVMLLGGQPCWDPHGWLNRVAGHASLRAQLRRAENKQVEVSEWSPRRARDNDELRTCLDEWLSTRGLPPLHFLIESDTLSRVLDRRVFVARRRGTVIAFLVASPIPARNGWLVEQIVRGHRAVNGTSELLIDAAMKAMIRAGSTYVSLGLAPLSKSTAPVRHENPLWLRVVLKSLRMHGQRYYNFPGLEAFKAKFRPERWEPVYAIVNEPHIGPSTLYAIASAFADRSPASLIGRALRKALRSEVAAVRHVVRRAVSGS